MMRWVHRVMSYMLGTERRILKVWVGMCIHIILVVSTENKHVLSIYHADNTARKYPNMDVVRSRASGPNVGGFRPPYTLDDKAKNRTYWPATRR